jgi:ComF family protein
MEGDTLVKVRMRTDIALLWDNEMKIIDETIPAPCAACGIEKPAANGFCAPCLARLPLVLGNERCPACGAENDGIFDVCSKCLKEEERPWNDAIALMRMEGLGKELIHRFKYGNDTFLAKPLGRLAAAALASAGVDFDVIVPVPLHWSRALARGYNQTALLCDVIAKETGKPTVPLLRRKRSTPKQASLNRERRKKNLLGAFAPRTTKKRWGGRILLVDDVMTTGSTLASAADVLMNTGIAELNILVLLRA